MMQSIVNLATTEVDVMVYFFAQGKKFTPGSNALCVDISALQIKYMSTQLD